MTERERDEETGRFTESGAYSDDDFIEAIRELGGSAGTKQIADAVGCHRDTARRRLHALADAEKVEKHRAGDSPQSAVLWMVPDDE